MKQNKNLRDPKARGALILLLVCALLGSLGCVEQGSASLKGDLQVGDCQKLAQKAPWQLESRYVVMATLGPPKVPLALELRIQMNPGSLTQRDINPQDILVIRINHPEKLKPGQAIPIEAYEARLVAEPKGSDPNKVAARAMFSLGHTCPTLPFPSSYALSGQVTFTEISLTPDAPVSGSVSLQIGPARPSSAATNGTIQGTFSLSYRQPNLMGDDHIGILPPPVP